MRLLAIVLLVFGLGGVVSSAPQQTEATARPPLLFREDWRLPKHEGSATDENTRFTPAVVTNGRLEAKLYGTGSAPVRAAEHEGRIDLWTGLATSPVALTLRDKLNYLDLTGLARLRWIVRTNAIHTLYPVVKLTDGTLLDERYWRRVRDRRLSRSFLTNPVSLPRQFRTSNSTNLS
jgi:hypothetical protein